MLRRSVKRMLFKLGVTVIILVAVYMYYAVNNTERGKREHSVGNGREHTEIKFQENAHVDHGYDVNVGTDDLQKNLGKKVDEPQAQPVQLSKEEERLERWKSSIHLAVVACGDRMEETLVMFKSAVLFTHTPLVFHIFTEPYLQPQFEVHLNFWPAKYRERVEYKLYNITFPKSNVSAEDWRKLFKPCACQRLFIPELIRDVDSVLYVDTDMLFLSPVENLWRLFKNFNSTQLAGVAVEGEDKATGWYNRFARHPFYGELGVNSGVMLMNLTRFRGSHWITSMSNYYTEYRLKITFGDQDLINIYFHYFPEQLYIFGCERNYRPDHCMYMSVCKSAEEMGALVLHGCRRVWFEDKQPAFKAVYKAFNEHYLGASIRYELLESVKKNLKAAETSNCGKLPHLFTKSIETYLTDLETKKIS